MHGHQEDAVSLPAVTATAHTTPAARAAASSRRRMSRSAADFMGLTSWDNLCAGGGKYAAPACAHSGKQDKKCGKPCVYLWLFVDMGKNRCKIKSTMAL